jgi:hypothetical protein
MKANVEIKKQIKGNYTLRIQTEKGTLGSNLVNLTKVEARILNKTLGISIMDAKVSGDEHGN